MIDLNLFASFTGLHLAMLQFCYFFLLLINVTSTYITYATIVISWMVGTLVGLFWRNLHSAFALVAGVVSYYAVFTLVINDPLSPTALPTAAIGVAITGLWAGRFFVVMLPLFTRADTLFFHENNGFMFGIIGVFVGFTLLGRGFLFWAPMLSAIFLMIQMVWLRVRHQYPELGLLKVAQGEGQ